MDPYLLNVAFVRHMIEHRFKKPGVSMAEAINQIAWEAELSPRYTNMLLMGDRRSVPALEKIEDAITRLSDDEGGVPYMCCTSESVDVVKKALARGAHYVQRKSRQGTGEQHPTDDPQGPSTG